MHLKHIFVAGGLVALSCQAVAAPSQAQLDGALAEVKAEKRVLSAAWNSKTTPSLLAGVKDDGTRRDGYAQYLCGVLADHGIKGGVVRVLDEHSQDWKELGKAWCP